MNKFSKALTLLTLLLLLPTAQIFAQALSQTLVTVNYLKPETIPESEFRKILNLIQIRSGQILNGTERKALLDAMIDDIIVMQAATSANIRATEGDVIQKLKEMGQVPPGWSLQAIKDQYNSSEMRRHQSWEEMIESLRKEIIKQNYIVSQIKPRTPTNAEIEKAYVDNRDNFILPTRVGVSHIFIATINNEGNPLPAEERQRKLQVAQEASQRINSGAITFEQGVRQYSEDAGSANQLGYLGAIPDESEARTIFGDAFMNAALSLRPGQVSQVITSPRGYHIIRVTDREEGKLLTLNDANPYNPNMSVRDLVFQQLQMQFFQDDATALIQNMRSQATININQAQWLGWEQGSKNP
ncbi:peptidylprolyl isomerase [Entomospira culicis]|uniref:PpiC domain-containing protein n=1 Tax=Entomospira culicis TaxID=2719989 RepID=A0A968GH39_9SPIO|nr:peptidylprolyl isomerase [Entomospira culicis]NIZ18712.1 hypothetical protein [Entomospira culicis]NIZ68927.1 hypothetical protein [Entomospira culicis]WDI37520.1 peptidylprolyl isomerase [Entomospira culicis]WDI39148.1 peptidylprolyl isomerase [Entomospira culicis]